MILGLSPFNLCTYVQVCGSSGLAAMLTIKRSAGVVPELNQQLGNEVHKLEIHPGFEAQVIRHQKSTTGQNRIATYCMESWVVWLCRFQ